MSQPVFGKYIPNKILCTVAFLGALLVSHSALAWPIADGLIGVDEGYTHIFQLAPSKVCDKNPGDVATVQLAQDDQTHDVFLSLVLPTSYVDNSYGDNAVGWVHPPHHRFKDLLNSDVVRIRFDKGGHAAMDFTLDYLAELRRGDDDRKTGYDSGLSDRAKSIPAVPPGSWPRRVPWITT